MRLAGPHLVLSATDLANFLGCRHRTGLDLAVASGVLPKPGWVDPMAELLRQRGEAHERQYLSTLRERGFRIVEMTNDRGRTESSVEEITAPTLSAMRDGVDVIVQARLASEGCIGYADILQRVDRPSALGDWSYEIYDTKLARETRGGTILQLAVYSDLLERLQGLAPRQFHVVTPRPVSPVESYQVADYTAYARLIRAQMLEALAHGHEHVLASHYPEPVESCDACRWVARCRSRRRRDDHLSLIAGSTRRQRSELAAHGMTTLAAVAASPRPVPFTPSRGTRESYARLQHQADLQLRQRTTSQPVYELLPPSAGCGLARLPDPSPGDLFLDLEGDSFAREGGREFLFGLVSGTPPVYRAWWAFDDGREREAFEAVVDTMMQAWDTHPDMHVYHFGHYEPSALKRLMGRYASREVEIDRLLRGRRFVDLHAAVTQALRAGVESYSIKKLEPLYRFVREMPLDTASLHLTAIQLALGAQLPEVIPEDVRGVVEDYNRDDCRSTAALRDWLEQVRTEAIQGGTSVPRPLPADDKASENVRDVHAEVEHLRARLLDGVPAERSARSDAEQARWLLAYLLDWHRREDKSEWWEYYRLCELPEDDLLDERKAIAGLVFVERVAVNTFANGRPTGTVVDRYLYPEQDADIECGDTLKLQDGSEFGRVVTLERLARTIEVKKNSKTNDLHPRALFAHKWIDPREKQQALLRLAEAVLARSGASQCGLDLLVRRPPRLRDLSLAAAEGSQVVEHAVRLVADLDDSVLAIQGPPGSGKTYTAARMICSLVRSGARLGVTAVSHRVICNLLEAVRAQAAGSGETARLGHKVSDASDASAEATAFTDNKIALQALADREIDVLGGTSWLWARQDARHSLDVLFVDEAGQMSLADTLAAAQAARSVVLLGDPQQLEQPQKGSHPDGLDVSALEHLLGDKPTMPADRGLFLPTTWRLAPAICRFTSETFYSGRLRPRDGLERQRLADAGPFDGAGLWLVPAEHDGNRSASPEEVDLIARLVDQFLSGRWIDRDGVRRPLSAGDLRIMAPYNAQVNRLTERLAGRDVAIGTVDKFQGQEAPVAIYSMTTSRPEDAPRGMEFLYSLNRLNVATSRARCAAILVASLRLFEPECRSPRQMRLANALCRYRELATVVRI